MTWLVTHMWIALVATSAMALLLGWSVRGIMLSGKMRQAMVERDMVKVELGSAREEVEKLFTQIRKLSNGDAPAGPAQDPILVRKVDSLTAELARKSAEIEALKTAAVAAPPVPAAPVAVPNAGQVDETLVWRNRHLERRVAHLEAERAKAAAAQLAAPVPAAAVDAAPPVDRAKLDWEVKYLRTRVEALQTELAAEPVPAPAPVAEAAPVAAEPAAETAAPVEEEIARLRWRVRFLEGRLAYFEGNGESEAAPPASVESAPAKPKRVSEAILGELEAADERAEAEAAQEVARVRPMPMDKPVDGKPDDLTQIGGIGPKIQDVLNSLGIFHFDQIADWTSENIAWVDEYLSFAGRITREGWVEQAAVLVGEAAEA
jgi:predicted flap endonuclease-1-like 5' DNA nuclease